MSHIELVTRELVTRELEPTEPQTQHMSLTRFIEEFGDGLLDAVQTQNPAVYSNQPNGQRGRTMAGLLRKPFPAQCDVVQAVTRLLVDEDQPAAVINAEMGTGKTMMAIAAAAVMHREGYGRALVISPPHLVYKWRREIRDTVPEARVWILNGPDTLRQLLQIRAMRQPPSVPEFFVMGRVRMRMGFNWQPAFVTRKLVVGEGSERRRVAYAACPKCGEFLSWDNGEPLPAFMAPVELNTTRRSCTACGERLWTLVHRFGQEKSKSEMLKEALTQIPIMRYVVPCTVFLKLRDIGGNVLPPYREHFEAVAMTETQQQAYEQLAQSLKSELREALRKGDKSLLGVVLNVLLAWPDCCFRDERVVHPHTRQQLAFVPAQFGETEVSPKEQQLIELCKSEKARGRRVLVYSVYTGTRDTTARLKTMLDRHGFKTAVLKANVEAAKREDWLFEQVDRGVEVLITNPELVKTGLDMLEFPTIVFLTTGYNVYTLQQAARRSWRIGQKADVDVYFLGYRGSAQMACLELMAKKIAVAQSTSGDMPESGLDVLNQDGDSIEVALARQLVS